jgi:hypothetical protein
MSNPRPKNIDNCAKAMKAGPMTIGEIADAACLSAPCVRAILRIEDFSHICDWREVKRGFTYDYDALHVLGKGVDAIMPKQSAEDRRAKMRKYRSESAKRKWRREEGARKERQVERERQERINRGLEQPAFRHWMDIAFFGPATEPSKPAMIEVRVYKQAMTITEDQEETV